MILLKNCRLIDQLSGGIKTGVYNVEIDEDKIGKIFEGQEQDTSKYQEIIDIKEKTLIPGLFELHTHLSLDNTDYQGNLSYDNNKLLLKAYEFALEYLKQGYTTVRDCGTRGNITVALRDEIRDGHLIGPRIVSCGQAITPTETGNESFGQMYMEADGKEEMKKACRIQLKKGNDYIKLMASGAFLNSAGDPGMQIVTEDEIKACVEIAKMKKTYVSAHCHSDKAIRLAIKSGVRTIEHGVFMEEDTARLLKDTKDCYLVPTGAIGMECLSDDNENATEDILNKSKMYEQKEKDCINRAYKMGLTLGFGSDIDMEAFKRVAGYEFIARREFYDFEDIDILKQATINSAKILGLDDKLGSVETGKIADLIVVDGNPDQDIYCMTKPILHIFKEGVKINVI